MDETSPQPELFVARDRARNFARRIRETLQERRLAYRGASVGMASLVNEADKSLVTMLEDAARTVEDVLNQRIRDRERGYMEMPLVVLAESVAARGDLARRIDRAIELREVPEKQARAQMLGLLEDALSRIDAFCEAYDAKQPIGAPRPLVLSHLLEEIEDQAGWAKRLAVGRAASGPAFDRVPPDVVSEPHALADVLHAVRSVLVEADGPWHIERNEQDCTVELALGAREGETVDVPERIQRAVEVLRFRHPIDVTCLGEAAPAAGLLSAEQPQAKIHGVVIAMPDPAAERDAASETESLDWGAVATEAGVLRPEAERAVGTLSMASPVVGTTCPPDRTVAWMGLFKVLDAHLKELVAGRCRSHPVQAAARRLPRDDTRKAPIKKAVLQTLTAQFEGFPGHRVNAVADLLSQGKADARLGQPTDALVVIALVGRSWSAAGVDMPPALVLAPLNEIDVNALIGELGEVAKTRKLLESGRPIDAPQATRMERALVAALARLGRVAV